MPEIPTLHESGYPGFDSTQWLGLLAPRGTGAEVVQRLHAETVKTLALPDVKQRFAAAAPRSQHSSRSGHNASRVHY